MIRFAVLLNRDKEDLFRDPSIPLDWPVEALLLGADELCPAGYHEMTFAQLDQYKLIHMSEYQATKVAYNDAIAGTKLKVTDLLAPMFKDYHPAQIDFRRHLIPGIVLSKNLTSTQNGRPLVAQYFWQDDLICEIKFVFEVNEMNLMTNRAEMLGYYTIAGVVPEYYPIRQQSYDLTVPYYMTESIKERFDARTNIIDQIKSMLNQVLYVVYTQQGKTYQEILDIAGVFWRAYNVDINDWLNTGSSALRTNIAADTSFDFLGFGLAPGQTVRDYIISKITY